MTRDDLQKLVLRHRHRFITAYNFHCRDTAASCAYALTQHAIRRGYVQPREQVSGETLRTWAKKANAPLWACKAACDLALENGYIPHEEEEWATAVWLWLEAHGPYGTVAEAVASFPRTLDPGKLQPYVEAVFAA